MKIRYLTGPRIGQTAHVENNSTTETLINLGHIEVVTETPAPMIPFFGIILGVHNAGATLQATCPTCKRTEYYVGRPDKESIANGFLPYLCTHFKGMEVPEETRATFVQAWRPGNFIAPGTRGEPSANTVDNPIRYGVDETGRVRK